MIERTFQSVDWVQRSDQRAPWDTYKPVVTYRAGNEIPPRELMKKGRQARLCSSSVPLMPFHSHARSRR
jgi:hypothetical protein